MFFLALASRLLKPHWGAWVELIYLLPTAVIEVFFLVYIVLSVYLQDRASSNITLPERRWLTSLLIVEKWSASRLNLEELLPAFRESTRRLKRRRKVVSRSISVAQMAITFFDFFVGQYLAPHQVMHTYLGIPPKYSAFIFLSLLALMWIVALVLIYVPLYWRANSSNPFWSRPLRDRRSSRVRTAGSVYKTVSEGDARCIDGVI